MSFLRWETKRNSNRPLKFKTTDHKLDHLGQNSEVQPIPRNWYVQYVSEKKKKIQKALILLAINFQLTHVALTSTIPFDAYNSRRKDVKKPVLLY